MSSLAQQSAFSKISENKKLLLTNLKVKNFFFKKKKKIKKKLKKI